MAGDDVVPGCTHNCIQASLINRNDCYSKWNSHLIPQCLTQLYTVCTSHFDMDVRCWRTWWHATCHVCLYIFDVVGMSPPFVCVVRAAVHAWSFFFDFVFNLTMSSLYRHKVLKDKWHLIFDICEIYTCISCARKNNHQTDLIFRYPIRNWRISNAKPHSPHVYMYLE